ncbi:hypothetical protein P43SY_004468 [Pythium insidiosum]|uniref:Uncharacterized protein n=1 Tax=Pythium insidiosum TaxID=114742 RepID=A0AAD5M3C0_PYTIN|nr:hypothetical protein P43SY_004468 [Pythium insidiosum]
MQRDFGLLSIVLDNFDLWQATRYVVLTCIADLCVGVPENAVLAAQKRVWGDMLIYSWNQWNSKRPSTALVRVALSNQLLRLLAILFAEDGMERKIIEAQSLMLLFEVLADIMTGSIVDTILIRPLIAVVDEVIYQHLSAYQQDATRRDMAVHCLRLLLALTTQCPQNARCLQKSSAQGIWLGLLPVVQADRSPVIAALFLRCVRQLCTQHLSLNHLRSFWAYLVELHPLTELEAFNEGAQLLLSVNEQLRLSLFAEHWDSSGRDYVSRLVLHICHLVETPQVPACVAAASLLISWCDSTTSGPLLLNDASSATKIGVCLARLACHPATVEAVVDVLRSEAAYSARGQVLNAVRDQYGCIIDLPRQYQASLLQLLSDVTTATGPGSNDPFDELTWGSIGKVVVTLWTAKDAYCCDAVLRAFPQLSRYRRLDRMQDLARDLREICSDVLNHRVIGVDPSVCLRAVYVIKMDMGFQLLDRETLEMRMVEEWVRGNYYSFGGGSRQQVGAMSSLDWLCTQGIGSDSLASEAACRVIARLLCRSDRYAWPVQRVVRGMLWVSDRNRRSLGNWLVRTETDFVDHVSWRIHNSLDAEAIGSFREAWEAMSHILESICMDEQTAFRLVRRRLVDAWLMEYLLSCDVDAFVTSSLSVANSRLLSCVLRHTESLLDTTLAGCIGRWLPLVQFCVYAIVFDGAHSAVALPALEILAILTRRDAFVRELWKVCQLDGKGHHVSVGLAILAPMAKLLDTTDASTRDLRVRALLFLRDMCSELGIRFIDELFRTDDSIETLIRILETSDCEPEQHAAACLLTELVCSSSVQSVFLRDNDAFLKRIVWWLHEGHDEILQIAAMDILRSLTSKSLAVGTGAPLAAPIELLRTVAQVLLVDQDLSAESTAAVPSSTAVVTIVVDMKLDSSETPRDRRVLSVILHCCVLGEQDVLLREFQFRGQLHSMSSRLEHDVTLEPSAQAVTCTVIIDHGTDASAQQTPARGEKARSRASSSAKREGRERRPVLRVQELTTIGPCSDDDRAQVIVWRLGHPILVSLTRTSAALGTRACGVFGRMLQRIDTLPESMAKDAVAIVTELVSNRELFCESSLHLEDQTTFLDTLVDWIAAIEMDVLTENTINALFIENCDLLLTLCEQSYPAIPAPASYFRLATIAAGANRTHCEVFARKHSLRLLHRLLDVKQPMKQHQRGAILEHAAHVVAKLSRHKAVADKFLRHDGLRFFGRIADLNVVRATFSAAISGGVRTGVVPLKCRNAFLRFDNDYLEAQQGDASRRSDAPARKPKSKRDRSTRHASMMEVWKGSEVDSQLLRQLQDVLHFVEEHRQLRETLVENRKKTLTAVIHRVTPNARVLVGVHSVLSIALDSFIDAMGARVDESHTDPIRWRQELAMQVNVFFNWLQLLEQVGSVICCGLRDLDPEYYGPLFDQLYSTIVDLPAFLEKLDRLQTRDQLIEVFLSHLERLLRRLTNKHELRGVNATGVEVVQDAKALMERFRLTRRLVAAALVTALEAKDATQRLRDMMNASEYIWKRIVGAGELKALMKGSTDSESLWETIKRYLTKLGDILSSPVDSAEKAWSRMIEALQSLSKVYIDAPAEENQDIASVVEPTVSEISSTPVDVVRDGTTLEDDDDEAFHVHDQKLATKLGIPIAELAVSTVPFCSLSPVLEHFDLLVVMEEKHRALLSVPELQTGLERLILHASGMKAEELIGMTKEQLKTQMRSLSSEAFVSIFPHIRAMVEEVGVGVRLRVVTKRPQQINLWRFLVRPVLRARVFRLYYLVKVFQEADDVQRQEMCKKSREAVGEDLVRRRKQSWSTSHQEKGDTALGTGTRLADLTEWLKAMDDVIAADPLSERKIIEALRNRKKHESSRGIRIPSWMSPVVSACDRYLLSPTVLIRWSIKRKVSIVLLFLAFWRHEELVSDLKNEVYAKAFDFENERDDYFLAYHLKKALNELIRLERFVLPERSRLRWLPLSKHYQNLQAIARILAEVVQLNSISFDPSVQWSETDQVPKIIQWLGDTGITRIGIDQVELKAILCCVTLVLWLLALKCANKFQETNMFLNRVLTKDLPSLVNGLLYMGIISSFFSFLACVDCSGPYAKHFPTRCEYIEGQTPRPDIPPFLLSHPSIVCWSSQHVPYVLLGLWGVVFFLPIGILVDGMSQVLFQQEAVDIQYAPVVVLSSQLIKALTATAQAFFKFSRLPLAILALTGNFFLFGLMLVTKSASLWYIKYVKCGIYASSCWSAVIAICRIEEVIGTDSAALNIIYMGWLSLTFITATAILLRSWHLVEIKRQEEQGFASSQRALVVSTIAGGDAIMERAFLRNALAAMDNPGARASCSTLGTQR